MLAERGLVFPPINELLRWQDIFPTFNKIALIAVLASLLGIGLFLLASRRDPMVAPTGPRNLAETTIEFIEEGIVMQTLGKDGLKWTPFLMSLFIFIFLCNIPGILPIFQMPATARIAIPLSLSLLLASAGAGLVTAAACSDSSSLLLLLLLLLSSSSLLLDAGSPCTAFESSSSQLVSLPPPPMH